jgi:glycosyltransferase involved in cell wall biosynthesis
MTDSVPRVSVALLTCNHAAFIDEALRGALEQDHPNLEIVVADDASSDGTADIVADHARLHPAVIRPLLHRGPRGIVANVNRLLAACTGEYVAYLDGDDVHLPGKVTRQVAALAETAGATVCHHPMEKIESGRAVGVRDLYPHDAPVGAHELVAMGNFIVTSSAMYRRDALPGPELLAHIAHAPDWLMAIEAARRGSIVRVPEVLGRYRLHAGQITTAARCDDAVYRDAMRTLAVAEARHPDLAGACRRGRRVVARWEAMRRLRGDVDIGWVNAGLRTALRYAPTDPALWGNLVAANARAALRGLSSRSDG